MVDYSVIQKIIYQLSGQLADYLNKYLPRTDSDWWYNCVIPYLPPYLQQIARKDDLHSLDTAALLKIFDRNWDQLQNYVRLDFILRNYIREAITIRNTWAHYSSTTSISDDIVDRHLDTLYRLSEAINATPEFLKLISNLQDSSSEKRITPTPKVEVLQNKTETDSSNQNVYPKATLIRLKSNPDVIGPIIDVSTSGSEPLYSVFVNNKIQQWFHSQVELAELPTERACIDLQEFKAYLTATQLKNPNSNSLFSLNAAKIDFIPHQFRPVLKFIKSDRPRLLIADGVGVGKTIEAGLILKELEARNNAANILIICPKPLVSERKWEDEMKDRFGESFYPLDGRMFRQAIFDASMDEWSMDRYGKIIVPYSLLTEDNLQGSKKQPGLLDLEIPPKFDLVIVDEAHHIRNHKTWAYDGVKYFVDNADAVILLTATPIQMGNEDLYTLLNLIRPDLVVDREIFNAMSEPNAYVNEAVEYIRAHSDDWMEKAKEAIKTAGQTSWGRVIYPQNPTFKKVLGTLEKPSLTNEERVHLLSDTESLHTFYSFLNRTRRRDIGEYAVRKPVTIETPFSPEQKEVYDEIIAIQSEILSKINPETPAAFMLGTLQRRAASCLPGIIPYLEKILSGHLNEYDYVESDCILENHDFEVSEPIRKRIRNLIEKANKLPKDDAKYEALLSQVLEKKKSDANNKVMIFSTFRNTLQYLANRLFDDGYRVGVIHGDINDSDRRYLRKRFKLNKEEDGALDILLFSEVGCEGLDYQFCDCMANYDLSWNPMKIEQRIGRIDRTGQKSEYVSIFNLITPETVDAEIYNRCLVRIGIFESSIGGNEEILGEITRELQKIGDNFTLSDEERQKKLEQLADNAIRKIAQQEELSKQQASLFGLTLPRQQMEMEIKDATSVWLSPESLENLINVYLAKRIGQDAHIINSDKSGKKLRLNAEARAVLLADFQDTYSKRDALKPEFKMWRQWLEGSDKEHKLTYPIQFESSSSGDDEDLITPVHPLVRQAIHKIEYDNHSFTSIFVADSNLKPGAYPFAIYLWEYIGEHPMETIVPISENDAISEQLFSYFMSGAYNSDAADITDDDVKKLDSIHYTKWQNESNEHKRRNRELLNYQKESLKQSHIARVANLEDQIENAKDENIRRMKNDELRNLKKKYEDRISQLDSADKKAELVCNVLGYGTVVISNDKC